MSLDPKYMIAPSLQEYFVDKITGLPLAGGKVYCKSDVNRTDDKVVYTISGSPPNYSYVELPNPIILSSVGTIMDDNNNDVLPYWYPYNADGEVELYYLEVYSEDDVLQFTREAWPNFSGDSSNTIPGILNFVPNPQFIAHTNIPATDTTVVGQITTPITIIADGGWTYEIPEGSTTKDIVTFERYGSPITVPTGNPRFALNINCEIPDSGDSFKDIKLKFKDVNKFSSVLVEDKYTYSFSGLSNTSEDTEVELLLVKYFGLGGSPTEETSLTTFILTPTTSIFNYSFNVDDNEGKVIGDGEDDFVAFVLRLPTNSSNNIKITNTLFAVGEFTLQEFPATTTADMLTRSVAGWMTTPNYDGFDIGLPLVKGKDGLFFNDADIANVYASLKDGLGFGELFCDGTQYETAAYSSDGIPYARLQRKLFSESLVFPRYGTGPNYLSSYITDAESLRISTNKAGLTTNSEDGTSGFVVSIMHFGEDYKIDAYTAGSYLLAIGQEVGTTVAASAGNSGFTVTNLRDTSNLRAMFTVQTIAATTLASKYFVFYNTTTHYYMWFKVGGVGTDPTPGGTGIEVDLPSGSSAQEVQRIVREALSGFQITSVLQNAASGITPGTYLTLETLSTSYYVWFKIDGVGIDPALPGKLGIEVDLLSADTNIIVGQKMQLAINSKYYAVPNLNDQFLRGTGTPSTFDLDSATRYGNISTLSGNQLGTFELDSFLEHTHTITLTTIQELEQIAQAGSDANTGLVTGADFGYLTIDAASLLSAAAALSGGTETRPVNANVNWVMKY